MKKLIVLFTALLCTATVYSQNTFKAVLKDVATQQPLIGATAILQGTSIAATTDTSGLVTLLNIPNGKQVITFRYIGYVNRQDTLTFPINQQESMLVLLQAEENELNEVTVSATRSSRTIANIPTRVEVISGEELDEKSNMKPGDIRMVLAESTGIQTQQTSATSGNSSIRIQGLDGKYTQIIRDGFPLYSGFSGGLGLLQVAPLDLKQVEVIKGSSSTLYGGGAIAGLVNLVSKIPTEERQLNLLLNGTSALGLDASIFYAQKFKKIGATVYAAYNHGTAYDPSDLDLTAIPKYNRYTLNPKLFFYFNDKTTLTAGINATVENRIGGDLHYIEGDNDPAHSYFEENKTGRYSTQAELVHKLSTSEKLVLKNSISFYDRTINLPGYRFSGEQLSTYSEVNYISNMERADWVFGLNFLTDKFNENRNSSFPLRSYQNNTIGGFVQNTWNVGKAITLETGIRGDYHNQYGFMFLPKLSGLWKINSHFSTRLGGGLGYKGPNVFTEDAERIQFRNVLPLDVANTMAERSYGANYDVNYRTTILDGKGSFSINQLFFYTRIEHPILLNALSNGNLQYQQPPGDLNTKGIETNVKITYGNIKLFVGYTYADVTQHIGNKISEYTLVSKHRLNNVLMYEIEDAWKIGAEAYYFSPQKLNDGAMGKAYWTTGFMAQRLWKRFSIFINFENLTDTRQTKFDTIYTGSISNPVFRDIYAPLDGFVVNGGIKLKL
ncbi:MULTISPECIES: TonB-dependent receptor [unclassified Mucilaginibacter]|uniref:TonB-dependent receptor n=1 Tax=unclassified Mucilaginibacter TaxID=2617802 RepID=UPI002AC9189D|nr:MULTISPECIES: TonB-dependent receptor [unclassified Mucilaginibacter]MEB0260257.1 TonB-dependent receptor [Mucilaginibacter sp. 10I4]MEB0277332.1 TonB-dependent receptor [Mucilaginibacter sp. 10B2]MEB0300186.1 TonB-dependent receptor [Mucilaginibacter sp. 5C4]WPX25458.1 TonB-dependent receptor [Mucilaginibacter sp. 5C4]